MKKDTNTQTVHFGGSIVYEDMAQVNPNMIPESQFNRLCKIENMLQETISSLEARLAPVLKPTVDGPESLAVATQFSPLGGTVDRVEHANTRLLELMQRIEL